MTPQKKGELLVGISTIFASSQAIFAKLAYANGVNIQTALAVRFSGAALVMILVLSLSGINLRLPKSSYKSFGVLALFYIISIYLIFTAYGLLPASLAVLFVYTYPAMTGVFSYLLDGVPLEKNKIIALVISTTGMILLFWGSWKDINLLGVACALVTALFYSLYIFYLPKVLCKVNQLTCIFWLFLACSLIFWPVGFLSGKIDLHTTLQGWLSIIGLSLIGTVATNVILVRGIALIGSVQAALICILEPLLTVVWAFLVFDEVLRGIQIPGSVLILLAISLSVREKKDAPKKNISA